MFTEGSRQSLNRYGSPLQGSFLIGNEVMGSLSVCVPKDLAELLNRYGSPLKGISLIRNKVTGSLTVCLPKNFAEPIWFSYAG